MSDMTTAAMLYEPHNRELQNGFGRQTDFVNIT